MAGENTNAGERAPALIEAFVRQLVVTNKAVSLYPLSSTIPRENATVALESLSNALAEYPDLTLSVNKQGLYFDGLPIFPGQQTFLMFAKELYHRRLALVRFHAGTSIDDLIGFLAIMKSSADEILAAGGYEAMMWEQGISTVTVQETQVSLIDQGTRASVDSDADAPTTAVDIRPEAVRSREWIELARVSANDSDLVRYLVDGDGEGEPGVGGLGRRFTELAHMAAENTGATSDRLMHLFADALWSLDPDLRLDLLENGLLPGARSDEALAKGMRRLDLDEIMRMLASSGESFDERKSGFMRAIKNLLQITQVDRETISHAATGALVEAGADEDEATRLVNEAVPTKLKVRHARNAPRTMDSAATLVLQLVGRTPQTQLADGEADPEVAELQEEALAGVAEADIIAALVSLACLESRETQFANMMSVLEDSLDALVARGEIETAAEAAITLMHAAKNPKLSGQQRVRLQNAVARFARQEDIKAITHTLRIYEPGQSEYEAAQRLLATLGVFAVKPLLDQLAAEQDRAERKALVDLISERATQFLPELTSQIADPRWYFVRNIVAILGSSKAPEALGPLERTLRHSEPRVRRETIRSLSLIHDRRSTELLSAALDDDDAQNVQLAARYLGLSKARGAVGALEMVARGEGRGNRENGPRIEAIEALGRMGAVESLPTLQAIARKRAIIGAAKQRELRTAAQSAISAIERQGVES